MSVPCSNCMEPVEPNAAECPHCGDRKMTKGKLLITAGVLGLVLFFLFETSSPVVTVWWLPGSMLAIYLIGWVWARSERSEHKSHIEHKSYIEQHEG